MKISEASSHQVPSRPVGIPVELRCVAIGPLIDIFESFFELINEQEHHLFLLLYEQISFFREAHFEASNLNHDPEHYIHKARGILSEES